MGWGWPKDGMGSSWAGRLAVIHHFLGQETQLSSPGYPLLSS